MEDKIQSEIEKYLDLEYTFLLEKHEDDGKPYYSLRALELEGCITTGDTLEEVARDIHDAIREWLQLNIKLGRAIPKPLKSRHYSGKIMLRVPPHLHESMILRAAEQGVSLNQYLTTLLSRNLGYEEGMETNLKSKMHVVAQQVKSN